MHSMFKRENMGYVLLTTTIVIMVAIILKHPPIEQSQAYHDFSDSKTMVGIPNFWNVMSNLPFMIVGLMGLCKLKPITKDKTEYVFFFLGLVLVSLGSSYYHLNPNDVTLVWDRLPMCMVFMALFSMVISEFVGDRIGYVLLYPLLVLGMASIYIWIEFNDLRLYALIQFYPILAIPIILVFFKSKYDNTLGYWVLLMAYALAKVLEHYDNPIHDHLRIISGHSLKHISSAIGLYILLHGYVKRNKIEDENLQECEIN